MVAGASRAVVGVGEATTVAGGTVGGAVVGVVTVVVVTIVATAADDDGPGDAFALPRASTCVPPLVPQAAPNAARERRGARLRARGGCERRPRARGGAGALGLPPMHGARPAARGALPAAARGRRNVPSRAGAYPARLPGRAQPARRGHRRQRHGR